jgi:hypothetical protein
MGQPHGENTISKSLFWFSLQGGCEGPKRVIFFSIVWVGHVDKTLDVNFCFDLVCKVVVEVQRSFILFTYMYKKLKLFFLLILSTIFMNSLFSFHVILFLFVLLLLFLCARERQESCMLSLNRTCLLHGDFLKVQIFHLDQCQLVSYKNNFYVRSASISQDWVFSFWVITNHRGLLLIKEKIVKVVPPQTN